MMLSCADRPRGVAAIVDKAFANMYCTEHFDLVHRSNVTLIDKAKENWDVRTKNFTITG
jgi:hypothetical protein